MSFASAPNGSTSIPGRPLATSTINTAIHAVANAAAARSFQPINSTTPSAACASPSAISVVSGEPIQSPERSTRSL